MVSVAAPTCPPANLAYGNILRAYGTIQRVMRPYFHKFGLSQSQWSILRVLYRAKEDEGRTEGLRMGELGQRLFVQPPSVTMLVRRLVKMGLVLQTSVRNDRRSYELRLTPAGEDLVKRIFAANKEQIRIVMGGLDDEELLVFCEHLERLNTHLAALAAKTPDTLD